MKRRVRVILEVGPVPGTRGKKDPLRWGTIFRNDIISWNRRKHITMLVHGTGLSPECYWLKYWNNNYEYLGAEEFIITQKYIYEEKG